MKKLKLSLNHVGFLCAIAVLICVPMVTGAANFDQPANNTISGFVWFDHDGDGTRDQQDDGIAGALVEIRDQTTGGQLYYNAVNTDSDGFYAFSDLENGTYEILETDLPNYSSISSNLRVVVIQNGNVVNVNFIDTIFRSITGTAYNDVNDDGVRGLGEPRIANALVELYDDVDANGLLDAGEPLIGTDITDAQGNYAIWGIRPGDWIIKIRPPAGASDPTVIPIKLLSGEGSTLGDQHDVAIRSRVASRTKSGHSDSVSRKSSYVKNEVVIRFRAGTSAQSMKRVLASANLVLIQQIPALNVVVVRTQQLATVESTVRQLRNYSEIQYVEPNYVAQLALKPTDVDYNDAAKVYAPQMINAESAWNTSTGVASVVVAVIDTGISATHPEFSGRIVAGYDFVNNDAIPNDDHGHGTHVSGIVAAAMNGQGMVGIAPGVPIMPIKACDATGYCDWAKVANGIIWAADHGARVINMSLGGPTTSYMLQDAVNYAAARNIVLTASSGNDGVNQVNYPAAYSPVIAVSATDPYDDWWTLSNYGNWVDVAAPGDTVWSTNWTAAAPNSYQFKSGTSMAAPHVAGLAGLLFSAHPEFSAADVRALIQQTAVDKGTSGFDNYFGNGRIDAGAAMAAAASWVPYTATPTPTNTPVVAPTNTPTPTPTLTPTPTFTNTPVPTNTPTPTPTKTPTSTPSPTPYVARVNSGSTSNFTDGTALVWKSDTSYVSGNWGYTSGSAKSSSKSVSNTTDDALYQKYREGMSTYKFTVSNGTYQVLMKWAEFSATSSTARRMQITIEGAVVESSLSIYSAAGGQYKAYDKTYSNINVTDGVLEISFAQVSGSSLLPMVSAIEIKQALPPTATPTPTPTNTPCLTCPTATPTMTATPTSTPAPFTLKGVNSGNTSSTLNASDGLTYDLDQLYVTNGWGYTGGTLKSTTTSVANTVDDALYQKWRDNPGEYRFTVPNGTYEVTLKFAEFETTKSSGRVMKITIESTVVESSLSIYSKAGGSAKAFDKVYSNVAVSDGVLNIAFAKNGGTLNPMIMAIKIRKL